MQFMEFSFFIMVTCMGYKQYKKIESVSNTAILVSGNSGEPVKQHKKAYLNISIAMWCQLWHR